MNKTVTNTNFANTCLHVVDRDFEKLSTSLPEGLEWIANLQSRLDDMGCAVKNILTPLAGINDFLDNTSTQYLIEKLVLELVKLPCKAARNILVGLSTIVQQIVYTSVHPINSTKDLTKALILFIDQLANPSTWTAMGVGSMASVAGQYLVTGAVISPLLLTISGGLIALGLAGTVIDAFLNVDSDTPMFRHIAGKLLDSLKMLPEVAATAFLSGVIFGAFHPEPAKPTQVEIDALARKFISDRGWGGGYELTCSLDSLGQVIIQRDSHWWHDIVYTGELAPGQYVLLPSPSPITLPVMYTGRLHNQNSSSYEEVCIDEGYLPLLD